MSSIFSLFNILSVLYILRSVQLGSVIWREWAELKSEPLTPHKKSLAEQASFFIAVPVGVLIHEFAHALAVWASGGEVVEFGYRVFWGYVVPQGEFTDAQLWMIAIAGTVGSLLFGLGTWLLLRHAASSSIRYFGLRVVRFQVYFSLVYYPLFTLFGFDGDWRTIYDFASTPLLSAATAVTHAAILLLFWRGDRLGWFEAPAFTTAASQKQFEQLAVEAAASPENTAVQLRYIDALRRGGATHKAKHELELLLQKNPNSGIAYLELAALQDGGKSTVPDGAARNAEKALALGLSDPGQIAYVQELLGRYEMERNKLVEANNHLSAAIDALSATGNGAALVNLLVLRNQVFRRQQNYSAAYQDLQMALTYAQRAGYQAGINQIRQELEVLSRHSGQQYTSELMEQAP
jgi:tetratricopeptide (TPR) repeat protein